MNEFLSGTWEERLPKLIRYLLYGVVFCMPLQPLLGDILVVGALLLACVDVIHYHRSIRPTMTFQWLVIGFLVWSLLATYNSIRPLFTLYSWLYNVGMYGGIYFLTYHYMRSSSQWRTFLRLFVISAVVVCLYGAYQYTMMKMTLMDQWVDAAHFPGLKRRMFSTLQNPNLLGEYLLIAISLAGTGLLRAWHDRRWTLIFWMIPALVLMSVCMLLTYSRGIWLSMAFVVLYWGIRINRRLLLLLLAIPWVLFFYHGEVASRLWSLFSGEDTSVVLRWALWDSTTYMIYDHPLLGIGWDAFWFVYPDYNYFIQDTHTIIYHAHNMFLNVLAEIGIPGALFYFGAIYIHAIKARGMSPEALHQIAAYGIGAVLVGITVSGVFDHDLFSHQVSIIFWQLLGWVAAVIKERNNDIQ